MKKNVVKFLNRLINESIKKVLLKESESALIVKPSTPKDLAKLKRYFDKSDFYAEYIKEFQCFRLEEDDLDSLEMTLDKEFNKLGISASYESE